MNRKLILASNSPRRKELLSAYGFDFEVVVSGFEEKSLNLSPEQMVRVNAEGKAREVYEKYSDKDVVVLGADTVVELNGEILGKPKNQVHAREMLMELSGKTHSVWTGYCIISANQTIVKAEQTKVEFNNLSSELIDEYIATGKPMDKAGAYGIQDGFELVKAFNGSFNNVVGLPIEVFEKKLREILTKN